VLATLIIIALAYALSAKTINTTGIIVSGDLNLEVYEDDKTTILELIDWGELRPGQVKVYYAWFRTNTTHISWNHDAPSYLNLDLVVETSPNLWQKHVPNSNVTLNKEWTHIYFELTVLPNPTPGDFSFNIIISAM